jgi:hypothetical protein
MKRPGGGMVAAGLAGLVVVVAGVWGQRAGLEQPESEEPGILVAMLDVEHDEGSARLVVLDSRRPGEVTVLVEDSDIFPAAPTWSPDGKWLAWMEMDLRAESSDGIRIEDLTAELVIWNRERGTRSVGTVRLVGIGRFAWSPDSRLLAGIGDPFQLWNRAGHLLAFEWGADRDGRSGGQGPLRPWSPDGRRLVAMLDGELLLYDRGRGRGELHDLAEFGLRGSPLGYVVAGWNGPNAVVGASITEAASQTFEIDVKSRTSVPSSSSLEEFYSSFTLTPALSAALSPSDRPAFLGATADGEGRAVGLLAIPEGGQADPEPLDARILVEADGVVHEFALSTREIPLRNASVVLVGGWPGVSP